MIDWSIDQLVSYRVNLISRLTIALRHAMSSTYMVFRGVFTVINMCFFVSWLMNKEIRMKISFRQWVSVLLSVVGGYTWNRMSIDRWWAVNGFQLRSFWSFQVKIFFENETDSHLFSSLAKLSMVLGAVGCIGAWFEKKALLSIVSSISRIEFCFLNVGILFQYIITMIIIFVALLLGVVFVIAFNDRVKSKLIILGFVSNCSLFFSQVALTARNELFESIRHYPGEEGNDEKNFRQTMNSIQKRVKTNEWEFFLSECLCAV